DGITAPYTFVSLVCSLSCTAVTPAVGASGEITVTEFGLAEGPHDPELAGTITIEVQAPDEIDESFTNEACLTVFVGPTMSYPEFCISAPTVTTIAAPPTSTVTSTATPSSTPTATSTATPSSTATATST